jgi:hypothetical protein
MGGDAAERGREGRVIPHFAYGSNMSREVMRRHAPGAEPVGAAAVADHGFIIAAHGHASIVPHRGKTVHGVLWRLTPRDCATLAAWESVAAGLYRAEKLPVRADGRTQIALVYVARSRKPGAPQAGYMELVIAAALEWQLPQAYTVSLDDWLPGRSRQRRDFRWT